MLTTKKLQRMLQQLRRALLPNVLLNFWRKISERTKSIGFGVTDVGREIY